MKHVSYSVIIPAYNESQRLAASLDKIIGFFDEKQWKAEILVVNDGSRDNTAEIARQYANLHPQVRLIENPGNRGKGYTVRNGMMHATGDVLLFTDADLSTPIAECQKLFAAIQAGADVVFGSRWLQAELQTERQPFHRQVFGRIFNLLLRIILGLKFKDTQCGFKAFTRKAAQMLFPRQRIERWGFDPELLFLAQKYGFNVKEVPVEWAHDDRSKINPVVDGFKMFMELLRIRWAYTTGKYDRGVPTYAAS